MSAYINEIAPEQLKLSMPRRALVDCYVIGDGHANFMGRIEKIENTRIMLTHVLVSYIDCTGVVCRGEVDHLWIFKTAHIKRLHLKLNANIVFDGEVYAYKRPHNGSIGFSVKNLRNIRT